MIRKLVVVVEALLVFAGAFFINVNILGKQDGLPWVHKAQAEAPEHAEVEDAEGAEHGEEVELDEHGNPIVKEEAKKESAGLVSLPAPFTADEVDRLARELFADRERLRVEVDRLANDRRELSRINKDLRSRRDSFRSRMVKPTSVQAAAEADADLPAADPRAMATIFDKMRPEAAAARLAAIDPALNSLRFLLK